MHHDTAVAGDDADVVDGRATAFPVQALDGHLAAGIDMDPVVLPDLPVARSHRRFRAGMRSSSSMADASQRSSAVCKRSTNFNIVAGERVTSISVLTDFSTRVERDHLGDQQIHHVGLEAIAVLQRAVHVRRESSRRALLTPGAVLDLRVDVMDDLLEQDVDPGASLPGL